MARLGDAMLNDKTHSVLIYHFTDPMMGLTYKSEPFFRQLETHFGERVRLQFVMGGLVRDVADFMIADDFKDGKEHAFIRYNTRLAKIALDVGIDKAELMQAYQSDAPPTMPCNMILPCEPNWAFVPCLLICFAMAINSDCRLAY